MKTHTLILCIALALLAGLTVPLAHATFNDNVACDGEAMRKAREQAEENYKTYNAQKEEARHARENTVRVRVARPGRLPGRGEDASEEITLSASQYRQVEGRLRERHVTAYREGRVDADGLVAAVLRDATESARIQGAGNSQRRALIPVFLLTILALGGYLIWLRAESSPVELKRLRVRTAEKENVFDMTERS